MTADKPDARHFNQKPRRKAEFVEPLNLLSNRDILPFAEATFTRPGRL